MTVREILVQAVLVAIVAGALGVVMSTNRSGESRQYRARCACENCRCRCHLEGGAP